MSISSESAFVRFYRRLARPRLVLLLAVLYLPVQVTVGKVLGHIAPDLLLIQTTFCRSTFLSILTSWSPAELSAYRNHFFPDTALPILYALFLGSFIAALTNHENEKPERRNLVLFAMPFMAGFCDLLENAAHLYMLGDYSRITAGMVFASALAAWIKWLLAGASLYAIVGLSVRKAREQRRLYTEIEINADAGTVWNILTDLSRFSDWNPFIVQSRGRALPGAIIECHPRVPGGRVHSFTATVTAAEPGKSFAWLGHTLFPGFASGEHIFEILPAGRGVTLVHRMDFWGVALPFAWKYMEEPTRQGFVLMNEALKKRAEATAGTR
ncbi:MAG: SRPBCC domain-containing protein [Thermodesulfobacteriota bacterium]